SLQAFDENNALKHSEQIDKLAGLFADFCVFIEITEQQKHAHAQNKKEAENFSWETI
ncbi:NADPH-dependent FMN reductase, partial [Enterococcus faecalis]